MTERVRLCVEGQLLERFIEKALEEGVRFSLICHTGWHSMELETDRAGADCVMALLEKYRMNGRVLGMSGWPLVRKRLKSRLTLLAGFITCITLLAVYSSFIWRVEVTALDENPVGDSLYQALAREGIDLPLKKQALDTQLLRLKLLSLFPEYSYVGVRESGVTLRIELAHELPAPQVYDLEAGRDLVASRDGIVMSVNALSGVAAVQPGDTVRAGQLLIRGEEQITKEETRGIQALGEVIARVWYEGSCTLPLSRTEVEYTGRQSSESTLRLLRWSYPLTEGQQYSSQAEITQDLPVGGLFLPLKITRTLRRETVKRTVSLPEEQVALQAAQLAQLQAQAQLLPGEIICDQWTDYTIEGNSLTARVVLEVHTDIAAYRPVNENAYRQ